MIGLLISSNLIQLAAFLYKMQSIPPQIPLYYSLPIGEDQLVEWWTIFLIPVLMNCLYFLNAVVFQRFFTHDSFTKSLIRNANTILVIVCSYVFLRILFLVS